MSFRLLLFVFLPLLAPAAAAQVVVEHAWTRALPPVSVNGAVYLKLRNEGRRADRLLGGGTPGAAMVHLHVTEEEAGVAGMRGVDHLELPAGASVTLAPGGTHLMLMRLSGPLREGDSLPLTLRFENSPPVEVQVPVLAVGASGPP